MTVRSIQMRHLAFRCQKNPATAVVDGFVTIELLRHLNRFIYRHATGETAAAEHAVAFRCAL